MVYIKKNSDHFDFQNEYRIHMEINFILKIIDRKLEPWFYNLNLHMDNP